MLFSKNLFAAFLAVAAVAVNGRRIHERQFALFVNNGFADGLFNPMTWPKFEEHECKKLNGKFYRTASSVVIDQNLECHFFSTDDCTEGEWIKLRYPGCGDLGGVNFNDKISSFKCYPPP